MLARHPARRPSHWPKYRARYRIRTNPVPPGFPPSGEYRHPAILPNPPLWGRTRVHVLLLPSSTASIRPARSHADGVACSDRKSTRLNSSHVKIAYAVFCLKKKKKQFCSHHHIPKKKTKFL